MALISLTADADVAKQLARLNSNIERYLDFIGVPSADAFAAEPGRIFVGEPISELEAAIREHAELTGQTIHTENES